MSEQEKRAIEQCLFMVHPEIERERERIERRVRQLAHLRGIRDGLIVAAGIIGALALIYCYR